MKKILITLVILTSIRTIQSQNLFPTTGFAGIGTASPTFPLDVRVTHHLDNGIRITQAGTQGPSALWLNNATTNGRNWTLYSLGVNDAPGSGNFVIADNSSGGGNRVFIKGGGATAGFIGINNTNPGNRFEITHGTANNSGLRFTNLNSLNTPVNNPGSGVLALNPSGDVIYVKNPIYGNNCGSTVNPLTGNWEIPMTTFNYMFNETTIGGPSQLGLGHTNGTCGNTLGKFEVLNSRATSSLGIGVYGRTNANGTFNYEIGTAGAIGNPQTTLNSKPVGTRIGVYGYSPGEYTQGFWAGYFDGNLKVNGQTWGTTANWITSDKRFKTNIEKMNSICDKLKLLNGYTYNFITDKYPERRFDSKSQIGLLAQEIMEVFPQLVSEDGEGYLAVNYQGMIPVLLEGIKEQQTQIESQQQQIDELKAMVQTLASNVNNSNNSKSSNSQAVTLSDKNVVVLNQNVPNPFAESTTITLNIPTDFVKAQIVFSTIEGKIIKSIDITEKGEGHLNVFANDLSNGMYSYSLIVDGKIVDTKKMVKQN